MIHARPILACASLATLLAHAPVARAQGEWILIDRDLREIRGELSRMSLDSISLVDAQGEPRTISADQALALVRAPGVAQSRSRELGWIVRQIELWGADQGPDNAPPPPPETAFVRTLELTDGQRWHGAPEAGEHDTLRWRWPGGRISDIPLDRVARLTLADPGPFPPHREGANDLVILANADRAEGFVERIGATIVVEREGRSTEIPLDLAAIVCLANPPAAPSGPRVWLRDGRVLDVESIRATVMGHLDIWTRGSSSADAPDSASVADLTGVVLDTREWFPLAPAPPEEVLPGDSREWTTPPRAQRDAPAGLGDIAFDGPMLATWALPDHASLFGASVELPPAMWSWGDCEVTVLVEPSGARADTRLHAAHPATDIRLEIPPGSSSISIEVRAGAYGPIQDRVILHRPVVHVRTRE